MPFSVILASLISIGVALVVVPKFSFLGTDSTFYLLLAESVHRGEGLTIFGQPHTIFSPFLSLLIAPFLFLTSQTEFVAHALMVVSGIASIPLLYWALVPLMTGRAAGYAATVFGLTGTWMWSYMTDINSQTIATALSIALFGYIVRTRQAMSTHLPQSLWCTLGVLIGVLYLTRPEYIILFPFLYLLLTYLARASRYTWRSHLRMCACYSIGFLLVSAPYLIFLKSETGSWTVSGRMNEMVLIATQDTYESVDGAPGDASAILTPPDLPQGAFATLLQDLPGTLKLLLDGLITSERNIIQMYGFLGMFFFALGVWNVITSRQFFTILTYLTLLIPLGAIAFFQGGSPNYLVQYLYIFAGCIGYGMFVWERDMLQLFGGMRYIRVIGGIVIISTMVYLVHSVPQRFLFLPLDYTTPELRAMGAWIQDTHPDSIERIITRKPELAYFAGTVWTLFPDVDSGSELISFMEGQGIRYVVIDRYVRATRGNVALDIASGNFKSLVPLHTITMHGESITLYELQTPRI